MQVIAPVTTTQLLAAGQEPLMKFEIYVNADWINLCDMPVERLTDGGLEDWAAVDDLTYWTEGIVTATQGVFQEATVVHSGLYSARILTTAGGELAWFYQDFTLTPGNICTVSLWYIKGAHAASDLLVYVSDTGFNVSLKSDGTWQAGLFPIFMDDSVVWKQYELEFTAHALYSNYRIRFYKNQTAGAAISYYIDDVTMKDGTAGNYLESASVSLGGASMTPNPVEGVWSASLFNEDSIFHPQHPTSLFKDYLKTERLARLSIGATYDDVDYYWQRVIGYMNVPKFSAPDYRVNISGGDYMKRLRETELRSPNNYWGGSKTFSSIASDGLIGAEIYVEADAMDINLEADNVTNWAVTGSIFASFADITGGSNFVGRCTNTPALGNNFRNLNVGNLVAGTQYKITIKYKMVGIEQLFSILIIQASGICGYVIPTAKIAWQTATIIFTALDTGVVEMWVYPWLLTELRVDQISIKAFVPYWQRYYSITGEAPASTGPYYVTLDGDPVWQGEGDEEWKYTEAAEAGPDPPAHPAEIVYFNINKVVANGVNNLIVYYFTQQEAEDVVADLLYFAGVIDPATGIPYASEAVALATLIAHAEYVDPNVQIDKVWFEPGTTCLDAIKKVCEVCDYRFYFDYDGAPVFRPKPTAGAAVFTFTDPSQIGSISGPYQVRSEIKNRIVIKGLRQSETVGKEETMPSDLTGEDADDGVGGSIELYGERTKTINNHLFQSQAIIDAMCTTLKDEYKDPKWYSNLKIPFNPVPLELGDNIQWEERLSPILNITQTGIIRDIKLDKFNSIYKCEHT